MRQGILKKNRLKLHQSGEQEIVYREDSSILKAQQLHEDFLCLFSILNLYNFSNLKNNSFIWNSDPGMKLCTGK